MASNRKLTTVIRGRRIAGAEAFNGEIRLRFEDGSTMTVKSPGAPSGPASGTIGGVRQDSGTLSLDLAEGGALEIPLAEETSSVMVRDAAGQLEYAD